MVWCAKYMRQFMNIGAVNSIVIRISRRPPSEHEYVHTYTITAAHHTPIGTFVWWCATEHYVPRPN
jgi:hypothetical protein